MYLQRFFRERPSSTEGGLSQSNSDILKFEEEMRTVAKGESVEVADAGDSVLGLHRLKNVPNQS